MKNLVEDCDLWQITYRNGLEFLISSFFLPVHMARLIFFCRRRQIDVVFVPMRHLWSPIMNPLLSMAGIPVIHCVHDAVPHPGDSHFLWKFFLRVETRFAKRIVTLSESAHRILKAEYGIDEKKLFRSKLPVFLYPPHTPGDKNSNTACSGVRFLFFGRLTAYKGLPLLIEAFEGLTDHTATLTIAGPGKLPTHLEKRVRQNEAIKYTCGWASDQEVGRLLGTHDVMVLPYTEASQSGAVMAALGAGMPCIVTPIGGLVEQIEHGRTGLITPDVSAKAVQDEMRKLCQDSELLRRLQGGASNVQHSNGAWHETVEALGRLFRSFSRRDRAVQ